MRKRKKAKHPYVIVGADKTSFSAMSITHKRRDNHRNNFPLNSNPNPKDKRKAYLKKQLILDFKFKFSKAFNNYKITNEDAERILKYLESKNKKK